MSTIYFFAKRIAKNCTPIYLDAKQFAIYWTSI